MSARFQLKAMDAVIAAPSPPLRVVNSAPLSSGSEADPWTIDERKRKRMISNRESARRSRTRKQQKLDDLLNEVTKLQTENIQMVSGIDVTEQHYRRIEGENAVLQAQVNELTDRLQSLNSMLHFLQDFSGLDMDIPEIPDPLLKPWQLPCPMDVPEIPDPVLKPWQLPGPMDIPEIPDPLLKPWQLPCPAQAIFASADAFQY